MMLTSRPNKHIVKLSLLYPPFYSSPMANTSNDLWGLPTKIFVLGSYIFINIQFKDPTQHTKCSVNEWWVQWKALWVLWKALYKSNPALLFIVIIHFAFLTQIHFSSTQRHVYIQTCYALTVAPLSNSLFFFQLYVFYSVFHNIRALTSYYTAIQWLCWCVQTIN